MPAVTLLYEGSEEVHIPLHLWEKITNGELDNTRQCRNANTLRDMVYHYLLKFRRNLKTAEKLPKIKVPEGKANPRTFCCYVVYEITLLFRRIYCMQFSESNENIKRLQDYLQCEKSKTINYYVHAENNVIANVNESLSSYIAFAHIVHEHVLRGQKLSFVLLNLQIRGLKPWLEITTMDDEKIRVEVSETEKMQAIFLVNCYGWRKEWMNLIKGGFHKVVQSAHETFAVIKRNEIQKNVTWQECYSYVFESVGIYGIPKAEFAKYFIKALIVVSHAVHEQTPPLMPAKVFIPPVLTSGKCVKHTELHSELTET